MEITFTAWIYKVRKISISDSFLGGKQKRLMNFGRKYTSINIFLQKPLELNN